MDVKAPESVLIDGRKLAYDEARPANPADEKGTILLLTGLGSKRLGWARQLDVFGREYRTIAMDHRDTGDSDEATADYTVADLADDAAALLKALGVARAHVVGISLGGFTALQFALSHADMLDRLVLVATSAGGGAHVPASQEVRALLAPSPGEEAGELAIRVYSQIMASEFVAAHPADMERIAETARYRPRAPRPTCASCGPRSRMTWPTRSITSPRQPSSSMAGLTHWYQRRTEPISPRTSPARRLSSTPALATSPSSSARTSSTATCWRSSPRIRVSPTTVAGESAPSRS